MAASGKCDVSLGSSDRPLYVSGQRGSYAASSLDRSGSFRENTETTFLSALPNMSRSNPVVAHGDVVNFFQCLEFDPKSLIEHKFNRQLDFKQLASAALRIPLDDSSSGPLKGKLVSSPLPDEYKVLKTVLREVVSKGRECADILSEALSVINKCFPSLPSRKRSRSDVLSSERPSTIFSTDKSILGSSGGKMGVQSHASNFELEQQKPEERIKTTIQNKRTRTSMTDSRTCTPARQSGDMDRDRDILRLPNGGSVRGEDRTLTVGVDGWEKTKMKKKRSGIKPDAISSCVAKKPMDGCRDMKQGVQPRLFSDGRSRLNDSQGFRSRVATGSVNVGKVNGALDQVGLGARSSLPRPEQDNNNFVHDRRDRPSVQEKERVNLKAVNKTTAREDLTASSPTSAAKINVSARAPRSNSHLVPKSSAVVQRANFTNDWELSHCTNNLPVSSTPNNRKRTPSARSSSPPGSRWAIQRPQKISRMARTNFVPVVSNSDDVPALDTVSDVGRSESGLGITRRVTGNSPQPVKLKSDHFSSAGLSESEESGAAEINSREKCKKSDDNDEKAAPNTQKVSTLMLPTRKNKVAGGVDIGDNVRRQGRTGRGFTSTIRSLAPMTVEKLGNVGTAKQLRNSRTGFDKAESKAGRPPTRKLSDRKAYTRQKHTTSSLTADFLEKWHEELLAAVNFVISPVHSISSPFWKQMEPFFCFVTRADITYLGQQGNVGSDVSTRTPVPSGLDGACAFYDEFAFSGPGEDVNEIESGKPCPGQLASGAKSLSKIPLCQVLLAALIPEETNDEIFGGSECDLVVRGSLFGLDTDAESETPNYQLRNSGQVGHATSNGFMERRRLSFYNELEHNMPDNESVDIPDSRTSTNFHEHEDNVFQNKSVLSLTECSEYHQYNKMSIDERILLEIQSIGFFPDSRSDLAEVGGADVNVVIGRLEDKYNEKASAMKGLLDKLLRSASETRELQEKEFEQHALDRLVIMAYEKYMTCWGPNAHSGKSASGKMAKQAALTYVKRSLDQCHEFEKTGQSCFSGPLFKDMFLSATACLPDSQTTDANTDGDTGKIHGITSGCSMEFKTSGPLSAQQSPYNHGIYSDAHLSSELTMSREESRVKKELLLDDLGTTSGIASSLSSSAKGKRSERDREGKGKGREALSRNGAAKIGRPASGNAKGERKTKTKPKQKTTQLSASINGHFGKIPEPPKASLPFPRSSEITAGGFSKDKNEFSLDVLVDPGLDLSDMPLPSMDDLGVPDDLGGQGEDLGSWLNIDDDGLQDHDFMGLEIPMDDLSELNMMV